jgi:hypothetical protein
MQTLKKTTTVLIIAALAWLGGACDEAPDTPTQPLTPSFSHSGPHSGDFTVWSLNEQIGDGPLETMADLSNQSGHLPTGPVMITAMLEARLAGGPIGNLFWNPVTNQFVYYGVTNSGFFFSIDLDRRGIPSTGVHGSFGGGALWASVYGNVEYSPYVQFRGTGAIRRYRNIAHTASGIRVNQANGRIYVGNLFPGVLNELDPVTNVVRRWNTGNSPFYLAIDRLGRVYATAVAGGGFPDQIIRLDPVTNVITRWTIPGGGLQSVLQVGTRNYIVEDLEGNFWFSETASNEYGRLNPVTNVFEEFTKPGISQPNGVSTSGAGPTLQMYGQEIHGNTTDVLTWAAATPRRTVVPPTSGVVMPELITAIFEDIVRPRSDRFITPTTATVTSTNGSGIDRFPQPPGVFGPASVTGVVLPNTIFGSVYVTDDVERFVSTLIVAPPPGPVCPPDDDEDDDGLTDSNESVLGTLLGVADSDGDGIVDGNDDANGNGVDDEDEDDGDDCPDDDSDGDGVDDEDEDDEDD